MQYQPTAEQRIDETRIDRALLASHSFDAVRRAISRRKGELRREYRELGQMEHHLELAAHNCALLADAPLIAGGLPAAA